MIYGSLTFMGLPVETLIKQYRKQRSGAKFDNILGYRNDFISWLESEVRVEDDHELQSAYAISFDTIGNVNRKIQQGIHASITKSGKWLRSKDNGIAKKVIDAEIAHLEACNLLDHLSHGYISELEAFYKRPIEDCIDHGPLEISPNATTKRRLRRLCVEKLARKSFSAFRTGFVISGFGTKEICPSLEAFEADGIVRGKLKFQQTETVDIDRRGARAKVLGFAQDDMIMSFLNGIDPTLAKYSDEAVAEAVDRVSSEIFRAMSPSGGSMPPAAKAVLDQIKADTLEKIRKFRDREFTQRVQELIGVMPKQEISNLARALIDLTTLKRRVTREQESVGGEVDVAIISKSEGFVWVKRKHYFPAELNPRFFTRHFKGGAP